MPELVDIRIGGGRQIFKLDLGEVKRRRLAARILRRRRRI